MWRKRYRQLLGLLVAPVLPSIAIAWLGWQVLADQRALDAARANADRAQADRDRQAEVIAFGADVRDRLNHIREEEILAPISTDGYSDPSVALVASAEGGEIVLLWTSPAPDPEEYRKARAELESIIDDATRLMFRREQPGQAAQLLAESQMQRPEIQRDILRSLRRLALEKDGRLQEADDLAVEIPTCLPARWMARASPFGKSREG